MTFDDRDVLLKASEIVMEGWCRGTLHSLPEIRLQAKADCLDGSHGHCVLGAIAAARFALGLPHQSYSLDTAARRVESAIGAEAMAWNDHKASSAEEVAEALRRAAE